MAAPPQSFTRLHKAALALSANRTAPGAARTVRRLPPGPRQLAALVEATPEFRSAIGDLVPAKTPHTHQASELLRRSGFYHSILSGASPEVLWSILAAYTVERTTEIRRFFLLDGCAFSSERFELAGHNVVRLHVDEIKRLGPPEHVAEDFFPSESLDSGWFTQQWFISTPRMVDLKPTTWRIPMLEYPMGGDLILDDYWLPLITLGLFHLPCFDIPIILDSELDWRLLRLRFASPRVEIHSGPDGEPAELPADDYRVSSEEWGKFEAFNRLVDARHQTRLAHIPNSCTPVPALDASQRPARLRALSGRRGGHSAPVHLCARIVATRRRSRGDP